ncbi:MAG TPA: GNAT family N-acetyltransferase [Janthinobacterium sp.]|nr:GNAT family N-acetyltransferase [Janthinobacterium sp.]
MNEFIDNIVWHTLIGPHARYSSGTDRARVYAPGFSPFVGFPDLEHPDFHSLDPFVASGAQVYCDGWAGSAPAGWRIESEAILCKMIWKGIAPAAENTPGAIQPGAIPPEAFPPQAIRLDLRHASAALALATLTRPGPFAPRSMELGEYFGIFDGPRLLAMAGARTCAGGWSEITGICTHPDFQGRGLARRLLLKLIQDQTARGLTPFLRVMRDSVEARHFYRRMGFCDYRETTARMLVRTG